MDGYEYVEPDALQRLLEDGINRPLAYQKVNIRFCNVIGRLGNARFLIERRKKLLVNHSPCLEAHRLTRGGIRMMQCALRVIVGSQS